MIPVFQAFEIDPPWPERGGGKIKRGANRHYPLLTIKQIKVAIETSPLWNPDDNCLVWFWATERFREDAIAIMRDLGFRKCCAFIWAKAEQFMEDGTEKLDAQGRTTWTHPARKGLGQWSRVQHEHMLLFRKGDMKVPPPLARSRSVFFAPRTGHSTKPQVAKDIIEKTTRGSMGDVNMAELFARVPRSDAWTWGHLNGSPEPIYMGPVALPEHYNESVA